MRSRALCLLGAALLSTPVSCAQRSSGICTGQTVRLVREGVLTVGADFDFEPYTFDDPETGKPVGFEVDLVQSLADQLGVKVLLVNRTPAALIPGLIARRHDVAASALIDSPDLRDEVCVSASYLAADLGLGARPGDPPSVEGVDDLDGRAVGIVRGSRGERWLRDHMGTGTQEKSYETSDDLTEALGARAVDGIVYDLPFLRHAHIAGARITVAAVIHTGEHYVVATRADNGGLVQLINRALRHLRRNGKLESLRRQWFGS